MGDFIIKDMDIELSTGLSGDDFIKGTQTATINKIIIGNFRNRSELIFLINKYLQKTNLTNGKFI